ncbi:DUF2487 family protein [Polycladomyces subterraneus]|uniref:YpiF family protein n=1 Tax=Polycladomyces subterraneus TaxID=1016997 RepID=A0ABT8IN99_9BACL|nr:DUF2487 family protein [Polycladomyces subterraneus]MDN4594244.1 YpiF family protein [Polycladomyces subterraneus]
MKWSQLDATEWGRYAPFLDTLLLPVFRVRFEEKQPKLEEALGIGVVADRLEQSLTGRVLLLPPIPYSGASPKAFQAYVESVLSQLGDSLFHHLILLVPDDLAEEWEEIQSPDLLTLLVAGVAVHQLVSDQDIQAEAERLQERIVRLWQTGSFE